MFGILSDGDEHYGSRLDVSLCPAAILNRVNKLYIYCI